MLSSPTAALIYGLPNFRVWPFTAALPGITGDGMMTFFTRTMQSLDGNYEYTVLRLRILDGDTIEDGLPACEVSDGLGASAKYSEVWPMAYGLRVEPKISC